jgi:hypothetical protein
MSGSSDVVVFILAAGCEETEGKKKKRMWINDIKSVCSTKGPCLCLRKLCRRFQHRIDRVYLYQGVAKEDFKDCARTS